MAGKSHLMGYNDEIQPFLLQLVDDIQHFRRVFRIQDAGWFIQKQDSRLCRDRPGDRNPLLLSSGECRGLFMSIGSQAEPFQQFVGTLSRLRLAVSVDLGQWQNNIFPCAQMTEQAALLEYKSQFLPVSLQPFFLFGEFLSVNGKCSGRRRQQASNDTQQRRFSPAGWSDNGKSMYLITEVHRLKDHPALVKLFR